MNKNDEIRLAVKTVAKFMGWSDFKDHRNGLCLSGINPDNHKLEKLPPFNLSLDSLVPVWEKLGVKSADILLELRPLNMGRWTVTYTDRMNDYIDYDGTAKTIQQAALLATVKAIEALHGKPIEELS